MKHLSGKSIYGLVPLLLFAVLATSVLTVLMTGAKLYGELSQSNLTSYTQRTAGQYLSTRIRQAADPTDITVDTLDGCTTLVFREEIEGQIYTTQVYCYDGYLRELFAAEDSGLSADAGEQILALTAMDAFLEQGLLTLRLTDLQGTVQTYQLDLSGFGEVTAP